MKCLKPAVLCLTLLITIAAVAQEEKQKPRIFVVDSQSWEMAGGFGGANRTWGGAAHGGARPQTAEIIKTFGEKCEAVIVTIKHEKADYIVLVEHEGAKQGLLKDNKFAVFNPDGDAIKSGSTRLLGNAVKDACAAIVKDWERKK